VPGSPVEPNAVRMALVALTRLQGVLENTHVFVLEQELEVRWGRRQCVYRRWLWAEIRGSSVSRSRIRRITDGIPDLPTRSRAFLTSNAGRQSHNDRLRLA